MKSALDPSGITGLGSEASSACCFSVPQFPCLSSVITMVPSPKGCWEGNAFAHKAPGQAGTQSARAGCHYHPRREGTAAGSWSVTHGHRTVMQTPRAAQLWLALCSPPEPTGRVSIPHATGWLPRVTAGETEARLGCWASYSSICCQPAACGQQGSPPT